MTKVMDFRFKDSVSPKDGRIGITRKYTSGYTIYNEWDTDDLTEEEYNEFSKVVGKFFLKRDEDKIIQEKYENTAK